MDLQRKAAGSVLFSGECTVHQSEGGCGPKDINNIYIYIYNYRNLSGGSGAGADGAG